MLQYDCAYERAVMSVSPSSLAGAVKRMIDLCAISWQVERDSQWNTCRLLCALDCPHEGYLSLICNQELYEISLPCEFCIYVERNLLQATTRFGRGNGRGTVKEEEIGGSILPLEDEQHRTPTDTHRSGADVDAKALTGHANPADSAADLHFGHCADSPKHKDGR